MYPKEQILIFEASNGMIDSHVGVQMQVHVPIFGALILHAFKRLGSNPQQYRGQSAILYSLTTLVWQWTSTTNKQKCHIGQSMVGGASCSLGCLAQINTPDSQLPVSEGSKCMASYRQYHSWV